MNNSDEIELVTKNIASLRGEIRQLQRDIIRLEAYIEGRSNYLKMLERDEYQMGLEEIV